MTYDSVHHCPRCELIFAHRGEVEDHLRRDHDTPSADADRPELPDPTWPRLLVAVDPHRMASPAVEIAVGIARRTDVVVELVSVVPNDLPAIAVDAALDAERKRWPDVLMERTRLDAGDVVDALLAYAAQAQPALVVIESHGRSPIGERVLGSVSADVVRSSSAPTLLVGPDCRPDAVVSELVVAIDGSDGAHDAFQVARGVAGALALDLSLVEVLAPDAVPEDEDLSETSDLRRFASEVDPPVEDWDTLHGRDVQKELRSHVDEVEGGVLVVGTHGRGDSRHRLLGGVAARTVRHSRSPVLVVSAEAAAAHAARPARRTETAAT